MEGEETRPSLATSFCSRLLAHSQSKTKQSVSFLTFTKKTFTALSLETKLSTRFNTNLIKLVI